MKSLSVVVPVFNECKTIVLALEAILDALHCYKLQIIVIDDGSTDGSGETIMKSSISGKISLVTHDVNKGKGAAIRTAFTHIEGDIVVIQDADLEYDPRDIPRLIQPILDGRADVVYGSRFRGEEQRVHLFWHRVANASLTLFSNMLTNLNLSDMETGYKALSADVAKKILIRENRFGVEPEITAKVSRLKCRIYEVPISYYGRDYAAGKKIGFRDAVRAAWCIIRYSIRD